MRKFAEALGKDPTYISKIEREILDPPGEDVIEKMASILGLEPETLMLMADKLTKEGLKLLQLRPGLFDRFVKACRDIPDSELEKLTNKVRDGKW